MMQVYNALFEFRQISIFKSFIILLLLALSSLTYANTIVITGNNIINTPTSYTNVTLDMTNGRFTINPGGTLTLQNCIVNIAISPSNPFFATLNKDALTLEKNVFNVTSDAITSDPNTQSVYALINVNDSGHLSITDNTFKVNKLYTVGFLVTQNNPTNGFIISNNFFKNFHGGIYLAASTNPTISNNTFETVSFSNIYFSGTLAQINDNIFSFPGNLTMGDGIDVVNADSVNIHNNQIASSSGYGIMMMGAKNITVDSNKITDGLSYGIFIRTPASPLKKDNYLSQLYRKSKSLINNDNITITHNYIEQNRYGLSGEIINNLIVINNIFIQRFDDSSVRQFWTNNTNLLPSVSNLTWSSNYYKEAFTQDVPGDNTNALQFVPFPEYGGVYLP
jgi:parallel beta-helix repeat protein